MRRIPAIVLLVALALPLVAADKPLVAGVEAVGMTVSDVDRSADFYSRVLKFTKISDQKFSGPEFARLKGVPGARARVVRMRLGEEQIELTQYLAPRGRPFPADSRGNDRWFQHIAIITRDMDQAYAWLRQNRVRYASNLPQRLPDWNKNAAGIKAFYFRDPDGHYLEILEFPPDKGLPKWRRTGDDLFLGIDHTAIVVANTDRSLKFYRDLLGMRVAGESENYGPEQEHLNGVFGAHLRITSLRGDSGPGIEFLEYLSPTDGRPAPGDARANDLLHWETRLNMNVPAAAAWKSAGAKARPISTKYFTGTTGPGAEFLGRDPDGHVLAFHADDRMEAKR